MMESGKKVVLITGASSGIGLACAGMFRDAGWTVYAGFRSHRITAPGMLPVRLDVCKGQDIRRAVALVGRREGRLDCLVNNAGFGLMGALEDLEAKDICLQFETNVIGLMLLTRAVLPLLREARGRIVNVGSMAGLIEFPLGCAYCETKFAVEGLSDSLAMELSDFGVKVSIVEPGPIRTNFTQAAAKFADKLERKKGSPYLPYYEIRKRLMSDNAWLYLPPRDVARAVLHAAASERPRRKYLVAGPMGLYLLAKAVLPQAVFE